MKTKKDLKKIKKALFIAFIIIIFDSTYRLVFGYNSLEQSIPFFSRIGDTYYLKDANYYYISKNSYIYIRREKNNRFYSVSDVGLTNMLENEKEYKLYLNKTKTNHYYLIIVADSNREDNIVAIDDVVINPLKNIKDDRESNYIFGYIDNDDKTEYKITINDKEYKVTNYQEKIKQSRNK